MSDEIYYAIALTRMTGFNQQMALQLYQTLGSSKAVYDHRNDIGDVVPADKEGLVLKQMEEQLCKDWKAKDLADLQEKTGITMLGDLYLTNNFLIKGDSIIFLFNQYEIAPYAAGLISVTVPKP